MTTWWTRWRLQLALAFGYAVLSVMNWITVISGGGHLAAAIAFSFFAVVFFAVAYVTRRRTKAGQQTSD